MTGKNQSYARQLNNQLIMRELRKGNCSATMLSQRLDLSNAALSSIVSKLLDDGYIRTADEETTATIGRKPVYYTVNENFGYIVVVSLSDYVATVVVSDMKMNIVEKVETKVEQYNLSMLYELILTVKNLTSLPKYRDIPLLGIDLSVPGKVNAQSGELQLSPQFDKEIFSEKNAIVNLFRKQFDVPVKMTNDINLACLGEMYHGLLAGVKNGMLAHVDEGIGGAFLLNGSLYEGEQGFAGEIGLMHTEFEGKIDFMDEFVSLRAVKKRVGAYVGQKVHTKDVTELYKTDDFVKKYVLSTAKCLGRALTDVVELLNISTIVLSGRIKDFGAEYLDCVKKELAGSRNSVNVVYSALGRDVSILGAVSKAIEALTDDMFQ